MEFLLGYSLFLAKAVTLTTTIVILIMFVRSVSNRTSKAELEIVNLTEKYKDMVRQLEAQVHDEAYLKAQYKIDRKQEKARVQCAEKIIKKKVRRGILEPDRRPHLFTLEFKGGVDAEEVFSLREEITAILAIAKKGDEVFLKLETGGGAMHSYGLAASQLDRVKSSGLPLTISVDKVAASGGYMMACVADKIFSAPFAIIGSIGVVVQLPNFNKLLKKHDIEYEQLTAGEFKRTLTIFGENTDKAREKFSQELEDAHKLFKDFVRCRRPSLDIDSVATGEYWFGTQAKKLGLVDEIRTSDDVIIDACKEKTVLEVHYVQRKNLADKFSSLFGQVVKNLLNHSIWGQRLFM